MAYVFPSPRDEVSYAGGSRPSVLGSSVEGFVALAMGGTFGTTVNGARVLTLNRPGMLARIADKVISAAGGYPITATRRIYTASPMVVVQTDVVTWTADDIPVVTDLTTVLSGLAIPGSPSLLAVSYEFALGEVLPDELTATLTIEQDP